MSIDAKTVAKLRDMTGAGMMAAKKALEESNGDLDKAIEALKKSGAAKAAKRSGRSTGEGLVYPYVHGTGKLGVMIELQCETDFVARNEDFKELAHSIAMHIAAMDPTYLDVAGVPKEELEKAKEDFKEEAAGKPDDVIDKIVEGKINKWLGESVLMKQEFVMDDSKTIEDVITEAIARIGENIKLSKFARFNIEGTGCMCSIGEIEEMVAE